MVGDIRVAAHILVRHHHRAQRRHPVAVHPGIRPVAVDYIYRALRYFQRFQHRVGGVGDRAQEVREVLHHILGVRVPRCLADIHQRRRVLIAEGEEILHGFSAPGNVILHLVDVCLPPRRHGNIELIAVLIGCDVAVYVVNSVPRNVQPEGVFQQLPGLAGVLLAAPVAQLVQCDLKLKAPAPEARGHSSRKIVLLDEQGLFPRLCKLARRAHTAVPGTDDNCVILLHDFSPFYFRVCLCRPN